MPKKYQKKDILVIGLGHFGEAIVDSLLARNQKVSVVDKNEDRIMKYTSKVEFARIADTRDEDTLRSIGVKNFDHVVVAIGSSIEGSIITTLLLKAIGIKNITVKASNAYHEQALLTLGIPKENVIRPEAEAGRRIAHSIACPVVSDYIPLEGDDYGLVELKSINTVLTGKYIKDLNIRNNWNVNIVAIKRNDEIIIPSGDHLIERKDSLIVIGQNADIIKFEQFLET